MTQVGLLCTSRIVLILGHSTLTSVQIGLYVQKGMTEWIDSWKKRNWRTADKKPVKNEDLWQILDALSQQHQIEWLWVKGHAGDAGNERADALANQGVAQVMQG